jgi:uncharacterized cupredoxin-like copper-binding protein
MVMPRMDGIEQMDMATLDDMALVMIPVDDLPPGATQTIDVTFTEPVQDVELEFVCAVAGHYDAGMKLAVAVTG